ncbi:fatty acyl-CoA hydrolase precursor, medium chain-like [Lingula anatina]|uniref:Fatty acyl-CoA hydrolase precursor, medium chain-like n=1 Tax=Lingula anatina TaxID=7574 RepID=A0A1S3H776_LINAN|nr:fatty acyl-CoA hydrolase precursor, medium chain-like [Lingula anatina]|eukprot:XP_013381853.1 fatty acyl-CoA hydrolase precursor, medium chain-like [Lingula anatina]
MKYWVWAVISASLTVLILEGVKCQTINVHIDNGALQGATETVQGRRVDVFLGIPFAKPPVGNLRFRLPEPAENWEGVKNATAFGPACMQVASNPNGFPGPETVSEDCLTLNVFVPGSTNTSNNRAVMVWIYGGGYNIGGTSVYSFKEFGDLTTNKEDHMLISSFYPCLAVTGDVIVVSMNYRLNAFGFLSTGDDSIPNNIGLWDQIEALKWIKNNIQYFGGDPGRVTIFGESAGGSCVTQLALTHASSGLFHRLISQSGAANAYWATSENGPELAVRTGNIVGCPTANTTALVDCLRTIEAGELVNASEQATVGLIGFFYRPSIDGVLLTKPISEMLSDPVVLQRLRSFDFVTGFLDGDGGVYVLNNYPYGINPLYFRDILIPFWTDLVFENSTNIVDAIKKFYYDKNASSIEAARDYVDFLSDITFTQPMFKFMTSYLSEEGGRTYLYYFMRKPLYGNVMSGSPSWFQRANHGDDLHFMIGSHEPFVSGATFTDDEKYLSKILIQYWSNFAKTGNPNMPEPVPAIWEEYNVNKEHYLEFGDVIEGKRSVVPKRVKMESWVKVVLYVYLVLVNLEGVKSQIIVYIDNGALQGATETVQGRRVDVFLGIPFAKPPVGDLRFRLPEPAENWEGVKDATAFGPACMQNLPNPFGFPDPETISEDCLTLNVFVPGSTNSSNNKAVMVWIYAGGYNIGGTSVYSFKEFVLTGDVIVVSMNYRLNAFGFLSTGDNSVPGNIGLWDQIEALKWIKRNIQYFGGDPGRVTIFGESAGGSSATQLALANASSGLFHRLISQSGTTSAAWAVSQNGPELAVRIGNILGCPSANTMALVDCLRTIDAEALVNASCLISLKEVGRHIFTTS